VRRLLLFAWLATGSSGCSVAPAPAPAPTPPAPVAPAATPAPAPAPPAPAVDSGYPGLASWHFLAAKYDTDHDGRITSAEYTRSSAGFTRLDADKDGLVTAADFDAKWDGVPRVEGKFQWGMGGPEVGEPAPEFELPTTTGASVALAALHAKRPLVLVFGSFT